MTHSRISSFLSAVFGLLAALLVLPSARAQDKPIKIAVVDLERVVQQSAPGKALAARLEQFQKEVQAEGEKKSQAAQALRKKIAEGASTLTNEQLQQLQKSYEDATIEIRRYQDDKQREGQKIQSNGLRDIEAALEPVFQRIKEEGGWDLILNNVPGVVIMASERVDLTKLAIDRVNAAAKGGE